MVTTMPDAKALTRTVTTVYLDADLRDGLKRIKESVGVPEAEQIRRALRQWLEQQGALSARGWKVRPRAAKGLKK
jgi:hypothetical protein